MAYFNQAQWERLAKRAEQKRAQIMPPGPDDMHIIKHEGDLTNSDGPWKFYLNDGRVAVVDDSRSAPYIEGSDSQFYDEEDPDSETLAFNSALDEYLIRIGHGKQGQVEPQHPSMDALHERFKSLETECRSVIRDLDEGLITSQEAKAYLNDCAGSVGGTYKELVDWLFKPWKKAQLQPTNPIFRNDPDVDDINESEYLDQLEPQDQLEPGMQVHEGPLPGKLQVVHCVPNGSTDEYNEGEIMYVTKEYEVTFRSVEYQADGVFLGREQLLYPSKEDPMTGIIEWVEDEPVQVIRRIVKYEGGSYGWEDMVQVSSMAHMNMEEWFNELSQVWDEYMTAETGQSAQPQPKVHHDTSKVPYHNELAEWAERNQDLFEPYPPDDMRRV